MNDQTKKTEAEAIKERLAQDAVKDAAAVAKAKADAEAKPKKTRKAKDAPLDADKLRELIAVVEEGNVLTQRVNLLQRLETEEGAVLVSDENAVLFTLAGITREAPSENVVLDLWCSAARRACLSGDAV